MDSWHEFASWVFYGILGLTAVDLSRSMKSMKGSIDKLNIRIAVVIEKTTNHEKRITKIENKFIK